MIVSNIHLYIIYEFYKNINYMTVDAALLRTHRFGHIFIFSFTFVMENKKKKTLSYFERTKKKIIVNAVENMHARVRSLKLIL